MPRSRIGIPYATSEFDEGGLVLVCPVCGKRVQEWVDGTGERTTNNYGEHYEEEHANEK